VREGLNTREVAIPSWVPITVTRRLGMPKIRKFITFGELGFGVRIGVHNNSLCNVLRGLYERVFTVTRNGEQVRTPKPREGAFGRLRAFKARLLPLLYSCRPWSTEQFVNSYRGAKQERVRAAAESLSLRPVSVADARLTTFVKAEKLNLSEKADAAPRVIQPRDPRYNVCVGPYLKACEKAVYTAIAEVWGGPTVMKGLNASDTAAELYSMWSEFERPAGIGLDASRFDQHCSIDALNWEHGVYNAMFRSSELRKLLSWQLVNSGIARTSEGTVKYQVEGCRMSGDMNTSLGNCLLMCAMVWEYARKRGVPCRLANNGDDCMVIMSRRHVDRFRRGLRDWFLEMGYDMKMEDPVYEFERLDFCQTRPVVAAGRWVMCRDVRKVLDKDTTCLHPDTMPYQSWLHHVGTGGGALAQGVPVLQEFYRVLRELGHAGGHTPEMTGMDMMAKGMECKLAPISVEARVSFFKAFGITPYQQEVLEQAIAAKVGQLAVGLNSDPQSSLAPQHLLQIADGWH